MLRLIKGAWPNFSEEKQGNLYAGQLKEWARLYGRMAVEKTIKDAINAEPELPSLAEFRKFLPAGAVRFRATTQDSCPDCEGTGWMRVFEGFTMGKDVNGNPNRVDPKIGAVRRCHCWRKESA